MVHGNESISQVQRFSQRFLLQRTQDGALKQVLGITKLPILLDGILVDLDRDSLLSQIYHEQRSL